MIEYQDQVECPVCSGKGILSDPKSITVAEKRRAATVLLEQGFGIRETARLLGYKSPMSVWNIKEGLNDEHI